MKKVWKFVGLGGLVVVVVLGTMAAVAFAQGPTAGENQGTFNFYERFRQALASILGISVEQYDNAVAQARDQVLNEAVTEGWLTQDQADWMRLRLEQGPGPMWGMGRGFGRHGWGRGGMVWGADLISIAAKQLGMSVYDLGKALQEGKSIADIAKEKGVDPQTIVDAYLAKVSDNLKQAVEDGRLTQKMADAMLEQAREQVTDQINATWPYPRPGGFGRGRWGGPLFWGVPNAPGEGGS
ncbi:MAG: hypothetical protein ACP5OO_01700 [Chloroflexia bacterium]